MPCLQVSTVRSQNSGKCGAAAGLNFQTIVAITYRVHDFENFDENFVQGTISPLLKSHIPLDGSVSLFKYLPAELKRI